MDALESRQSDCQGRPASWRGVLVAWAVGACLLANPSRGDDAPATPAANPPAFPRVLPTEPPDVDKTFRVRGGFRLDLLAAEQPLDVRTVDVTRDPALAERYLLLTPVVEIAGGPTLQPPISIGQLRSALAAVQDLT